jgi:sugar phosphate isomerase/epimerase
MTDSPSGNIRIACQTYTWEMLGDDWHGSVTDLLDWISDADYQGIEITSKMIADFYDRPADFAAACAERNLVLAAFAYASPSGSGFTDADRLDADLAGARGAIEFTCHFPGAKLELGGAAHPSRDDIWTKLDQALVFYNVAGLLAADAGVPACVHPHSHFGSLLESAEEYAYLLDRLDPGCANFCPDTGHIVRGGQDLLTCLRTTLPRIIHVHLKDADANRRWVGLGEGLCDYPAVFDLLESAGYDGWVVAEEESATAREDGIAAINRNRAYLRSIGY